MKKTVYFVRHGETSANLEKIWQDGSDELSSEGVRQAQRVAKRVAGLNLDFALTSSMKRAVDTAQAIAHEANLEFTESDLFIEARVPTETVGQKFVEEDGNICFEYIKARSEHKLDSHFRYSDEETLAELYFRAKEALAYLDAIDAENIVVVTHGTFLRMLINTVLHQEVTDNPFIIFSAGRNMQTTNTGMSVIHKMTPDNNWSVLTFNDQAHFAE